MKKIKKLWNDIYEAYVYYLIKVDGLIERFTFGILNLGALFWLGIIGTIIYYFVF